MLQPESWYEHEIIEPPSDLAADVRFFWELRSLAVPDGDRFIFRTMANGNPQVLLMFDGDLREAPTGSPAGIPRYAVVIGATEETGRFQLSCPFGITGCCLEPAAARFIQDLTNIEGEIHHTLIGEPTTSGRVSAIATWLRQHLVKSDRMHPISRAFSQLKEAKGQVTVATLADDHAMSLRTFERKFREYAGMSPKSYARIVRFQSSLKELSAQRATLTEIAHHCGYYDQAHFIRDFAEFSGFTPKWFTTDTPQDDPLWREFVAFFQFLSWCPPVLCKKTG